MKKCYSATGSINGGGGGGAVKSDSDVLKDDGEALKNVKKKRVTERQLCRFASLNHNIYNGL